MIFLYTGTPGSGKSLRLAGDIMRKLRRKQNVIANFPIDVESVQKKLIGKRKIGDFVYKNNMELTPQYLVDYALQNHKQNKESQTLLCIDEAQILFNSRSFGDKGRMDWITFFSQHRKLGYNIILVTQMDRMLDRQIRGLVETEYKHRKINNFKVGQLLPVSMFICVEYWYGVREKVGSHMFLYNKRHGGLYNTYELFK